ncbi:putative MFS transporter, AGZA family, xanthine/uracil permease [Evansella caseinilytica]|uniref:Putative MFS transporter, AGZA family, xanthine/uracil permease n=1 Tax=Evansella caseinilytica TaxID=1503961 RepID=A0A1H3L3U4_9BACI|nr:NCS2 family permease [Evansella caseinilytica]SDY59177.1 putative MFS transporter, AGZA family, xanthine/uracil permease [Evansella caseinilytica]
MSEKTIRYPWFKKEDTDAFFALFQNNLANFVIIAVTMLGLGFPAEIVFGKVIPGAAVAVIFGNLYYAYMANRLAKKENRTNVTALSYGISTPVMFVFLFGVLVPANTLTGDPELAWKIALAAAFISGLIEVLASFTGKWIQRHLPRAAMLGALAGVALAFIAGEMLFKTLEMPVVGLFVLAVILLGIVGKVSLPFKIPASLFAIIVGTILAFGLGYADVGAINEGLSNLGFYPLLPSIAVFEGFQYLFGTMIALLAVILPITIYNAVETMNNVEAMSAEGDSYDVRECQAVDGVGTMLGAVFGGMFPTTVYIASVGSKWMGAGRGYSILNAGVFALTAVFGVIAALSAIIPVAVVAPILVYVGISMVSSAFSTNDKKYYLAVSIAMLPYFANYLMTRFNGNHPEMIANLSEGIVPLGQGAMFTAIILGAITVFIIDHQFHKAAIFSFVAAVLSFVGLMHAPSLQFGAAVEFAIGYAVIGVFFGAYWLKDVRVGAAQKEKIKTEAA